MDKNDIISFCESKSEVFDSVGESSKNEFFKKWRRHYYITYRTVSGTTQFLPTDWEKQIDEYYGKLLSSNIQGCEFAIHWDETFVPFECIGKKTLERSGVHKVPVKTTGQEKEGCTVLLGGMYKKSTGQSYKLPPFFIFKLETSGTKVQPVIERKAEALGAYATTTDSGWMKDEKFLWYVIEILDNWLSGKRFGTRDERLEVHVQEGRTLKKNEVAIIIDVHASHKTDRVLDDLRGPIPCTGGPRLYSSVRGSWYDR